MMVGVLVGCGGDSPTGEEKRELLVWTTTWENGNVKEEYQYYNHPKSGKRIKHGWYNLYYEDGKNEEIGTYKDDKRDGKYVWYSQYYESGKVYSEVNYVNGKEEGKWVWYYESGKVGGGRKLCRWERRG